ncbi:acyl-CoA dehydrogenase C-terminal domain-containing protein [Pelomicrobium sp. G1]|uniref:acyl-CoA dehydrogenase C-terminal domain-containing protein n=1 Tax=Pelomicrobium sp. G1 TaxID=3452920 RepID=UPI003F765BC3
MAGERLQDPQADEAWCRAKRVTARFYAEHCLPQALALALAITRGADSVLALDASAF